MEKRRPHPGRLRMEITCRVKGEVVFHKAGPSNIVLGLYTRWLRILKIQDKWLEVARRHGQG